MLRLMEVMGLLESSVVDCLTSGDFRWRYRTFKRGADCWCDEKSYAHLAAPSLDTWDRKYHSLDEDKDGRKIVCPYCGKVDAEGTHNPELM